MQSEPARPAQDEVSLASYAASDSPCDGGAQHRVPHGGCPEQQAPHDGEDLAHWGTDRPWGATLSLVSVQICSEMAAASRAVLGLKMAAIFKPKFDMAPT
jgi:hypothetical protein